MNEESIFPKESDTITFLANEICIGSDHLCLKFDYIPLDLSKINKLVFQNMDGSKKHEFKKL